MAEVHRVLHHPKFQQYIDNQQASPGELFAKIASLCTIIQVDRVVKGVCSDADDEKFLSCALAANVEVLVSGDKHLLNLLQYQSVRIVIVKERSLRVMDQIAEITSDLNIKYDLSISPVVFSEQEYDMNAKMASPFSLAVHEIYLQGDYASLPEPG